jgi:predicted aldo/keto reductase-like oxidoreductase
MEPLRGGKLVNMLPEAAKKVMNDSKRDWTPAQWSFRWLYNQPEVTVVLSGMNSIEMVRENCRTASDSEAGQFTAEDFETLRAVTEKIRENEKVGCTGCRYCMPCPKGVDIPGTFAAYNRRFSEGKFWGLVDYFMCTALRKNSTAASSCIGCGKCEKHCPQGIPIREKLKDAERELEGTIYKGAKKVASWIMKF